MSEGNHITRVAVVGAGGHVGSFIVDALLNTGKHAVTALTRTDSQSKMPEDVKVKQIDYSKPETIVDALAGQDALIITLGGHAAQDTETKLVDAAGRAGVPWILPNEWSPDTANEALVRDVSVLQSKVKTRKAIEELGKNSYIAVSTGFWYEWSLAISPAFGMDLVNHTATFFDDGEAKICTSTWPQVGRAVAALLSLPIRTEGVEDKPCLENFRNKVVYVKSFTASQKDMFESALRVTGTTRDDWTISKEVSSERYSSGIREIQEGVRVGFAKMLYTRVFYPDGCGNFEQKGTLNSVLDLPVEDIDEATKIALERAQKSTWFS